MVNDQLDLIQSLKSAAAASSNAFPGQNGRVYINRFEQSVDYLETRILNQIEQAALLEEARKIIHVDDPNSSYQGLIYLNDHGPKHIEAVIKRAGQLLYHMNCDISAYEIYILVMAACLHDVGNIFGRDGHEAQIGRVMAQMGSMLGDDPTELKVIRKVAAAHGGNIAGNRDTIGQLPIHDVISECRVRMQLLAAVLRFADELADGRERASRFLVESQDVTGSRSILDGSEVFHMYSLRLHSVLVEEERVELYFEINEADVMQTYQKLDKHVYLLDEIFNRTLKMHYECIYCMRYIRNAPPLRNKNVHHQSGFESTMHSNLRTIKVVTVEIKVFRSFYDDEPSEVIRYSLKEKGYPRFHPTDIYTMCPEITNGFRGMLPDSQNLSGGSLRTIMEGRWN